MGRDAGPHKGLRARGCRGGDVGAEGFTFLGHRV